MLCSARDASKQGSVQEQQMLIRLAVPNSKKGLVASVHLLCHWKPSAPSLDSFGVKSSLCNHQAGRYRRKCKYRSYYADYAKESAAKVERLFKHHEGHAQHTGIAEKSFLGNPSPGLSGEDTTDFRLSVLDIELSGSIKRKLIPIDLGVCDRLTQVDKVVVKK